MKKKKAGSYLGKYREIVVAVAFFLVFDLAVLVLNFYISFQISDDALAINLAGRQRMLSQRMTKALVTAQGDTQRGTDTAPALTELKQTAGLFNATLLAFEQGGTVPGGDGKPAALTPVADANGLAILADADHVWRPMKTMLDPITSGNPFTPEQLDGVVTYARQNNLTLLALMNSLTTHLEQAAGERANRLRAVQTAGIILAMLNFAFILFKFLRRLRQNDRQIEIAQKETAEILGTVKEGLFLLDPDLCIGSQYSASLSPILGREVRPGADFRALLQDMVPPSVFTSACDYIGLLFGDRVKEALVTELNPLVAVAVSVPGARGPEATHHLTLQFNRVLENGRISHLLVTVFDVTVQVELERALTEAKQRARAEIEVMLDLLKVEPAALDHFLNEAERTLLGINDQLRGIGHNPRDYRHTVAAIFRQMHALKGEAATLGLSLFEDLAQQFEALLIGLRNKEEQLSGDDLLALPLPLDEFLQRIGTVRDLVSRLARYHDTFAQPEDENAFTANLARLAQRIAADHGKSVAVVAQLELLTTLPETVRKELKDIAVQLLRNAIAHGIEPVTERAEKAKPPTGSVHVELKPLDRGEYELCVRDDGCGLVPGRIRSALLASGRHSEAELDQLSDRQILMKIFEPGFSTAREAGRDAGHGVGMDIVKQKIEQLGARMQISTRQNTFTQFSIRFAA